MSADALLALALEYSRLGRRVFPVSVTQDADGKWDKHPCVKGYFGSRPYFEHALRRMPWPTATHLGMAMFPGEVALDFDVKNGKQGRVHLEQLSALYGPLPGTVGQTTMSGGWHWLYRAQLPSRLVAHLGLPDGGDADIDVIHGGYRYLVLYEPERLLQAWATPAELPPAWCAALERTAAPRRSATGERLAPQAQTIAELIEQVRRTEDRRNQTLNRNVFLAVKSCECTPQDLEAFREAALATDLPEDEVDKVLDSAVAAALKDGAVAISWYLAVKEHLQASTKRNRMALLDAAGVLARTSAITGKVSVDMSVRCLAEELGVSQKTAGGLLNALRADGWLQRRNAARGLAKSYSLLTPPGSRGDTQPLLPEGCVSPFDAADLLRRRLRRLSAFQRLGKGAVLPPGVLAVCVALASGAKSRTALAEQTGCSRSTITRALRILVSAGLVDVEDGLLVLRGADLPAALEHWASVMGVDGRQEFRAYLHELQRQAFGHRQSNLDNAVDQVMAARAVRALGPTPTPVGTL